MVTRWAQLSRTLTSTVSLLVTLGELSCTAHRPPEGAATCADEMKGMCALQRERCIKHAEGANLLYCGHLESHCKYMCRLETSRDEDCSECMADAEAYCREGVAQQRLSCRTEHRRCLERVMQHRTPPP